MTFTLSVGHRSIGPNQPCLLIAEAGTACLGDMNAIERLIDVAATAGIDAVKFQLIDPEQDSRKEQSYKVELDGVEGRAHLRAVQRLFANDPWQVRGGSDG